jgi:hypothetical protein
MSSHLRLTTCFYYYIVATIGMRDATLTQIENAASIDVCVTLINSMQLEISLTAFIETSPVTATG